LTSHLFHSVGINCLFKKLHWLDETFFVSSCILGCLESFDSISV